LIGLVPVCSDQLVKCKTQPYLGRIKDEYFVLYFVDGQYFDSDTCPYQRAIFYRGEEVYSANELYEVAMII
jgi:hypothetical protein